MTYLKAKGSNSDGPQEYITCPSAVYLHPLTVAEQRTECLQTPENVEKKN